MFARVGKQAASIRVCCCRSQVSRRTLSSSSSSSSSTPSLSGGRTRLRSTPLAVVLRSQRKGYATEAPIYYTAKEEENDKLLEAVKSRVLKFKEAQESAGETVQDQIERSRTIKELAPLAEAFETYAGLRKALADLQPHLSDPDESLRELFELEQADLEAQLDESLDTLPHLLLPPPATNPLPTVLSLNAGVGGSEASLFVEEMSRMYIRFAEKRGWTYEVISQTEGPAGKGGGGLREITIKFAPAPYAEEDAEVYGLLKYERGVHRVQRVPVTETMGRVHTSTVAAVVLPIYPDVPDAPLVDPKDVKTEVMRSRGAGGQHVNRTESAVRLTHIPTGISVSMQDSRSQHQNRAWAWDVLRARLSERKHEEEVAARRASRLSQVKGADRSDKVRTYNFPQDRLTDHRIGLSLTGLKEVMDGDGLDYVLAALKSDLDERRLEAVLLGEEDFDE